MIEDRGKNFIFLRLSKECVDELHLTCDQEFFVEVSLPMLQMRIMLVKCGSDIYAPFRLNGGILLCSCRSVGLSVGLSVSIPNLVLMIT